MNIIGSLQLGFIYSLLALGVFISFRIMNTPDLTADGSFTLGLCASTMCALAGHPFLGIGAGVAAGAFSGALTGFLQTKAGIQPILAGILTMTALYSVNLVIMLGSPNISLIGKTTLFSRAQEIFFFADRQITRLAVTALFSALCVILLAWFFKTGLGLRIRATGNNEKMVRASSINADVMRILAIGLANAMIGLSGAVIAQYQGYADINAGTGIVIVGLASVIIGETARSTVKSQARRIGLWKNAADSVLANLIFASLGAIIYRVVIAFILRFDFFPAFMLKFLSALIVALALALPKIRAAARRQKRVQGGAQ
jgi:putative ABC transport system permease protein